MITAEFFMMRLLLSLSWLYYWAVAYGLITVWTDVVKLLLC